MAGFFFKGKSHENSKIKHVFVLMLENRSFDHILGFSNITGSDAINGMNTAINGLSPNQFFNLDPHNANHIFAATPADFKLSSTDKDPGHEFNDTVMELCGLQAQYDRDNQVYPPINNFGFVANYRSVQESSSPDKCMKCYAAEQVPVITQLAKEFAVCDQYFSSMPGPTWPNRFFMHAATSGGLDDSPDNFRTVTATMLNGYEFENGSFYDCLDDNDVPWIVFRGDSLPQILAVRGMKQNRLFGKIRDFDDFDDIVNDEDFDIQYIFIEPNYGKVLPGPGDDFSCGNSQHPLDDITRGEKLIKHVYETIRNSPHWNDSVLIINYDEHGGFFDHASPSWAVEPGDEVLDPHNVQNNFDFKQLGVRVPCIVVSPFIPKNIIDHTLYDHTSVLKTVEELYQLDPLTERDKAANSMSHLFSLDTPRTDAPTVLAHPPDSGFRCFFDEDEDSPVSESSSTSSALVVSSNEETKDNAIEPLMRGFMHVAFLRDYHSKIAGRDKLIIEFLKIRTNLEAKRFISRIKKKYKKHDLRAIEKKRRSKNH
jgi:phospholipase C